MIVPGSIQNVNHPFSWYAIVKERATGKQYTYWFNGNHLTREAVALHIETYFRAVEVVTIDVCTKMPERPLQPVPPHHFQFGILKMMEGGDQIERPTLSRSPINRMPLSRLAIARR